MTMKCCASIKSGLPADASLPNPCNREFVSLLRLLDVVVRLSIVVLLPLINE